MLKIFKRKKEQAPPKKKAPVNIGAKPGKRNFNAGISDRLNASWSASSVSADQLIYSNLPTLRARSREQSYNNDYAERFISMVKSNVVGQNGVGVQSQVTGRDGEPDNFAQDAIEKHWKRWGKKRNCSLDGRLSWKEITGLCISTAAVDGEAIVRFHSAGAYGLKLELIDTETLDIKYNERLKNGRYIRFGIEFDSSNAVIAYHFLQPDEASGSLIYTSSYNRNKYLRVPADQILHIFIQKYVNQKRGLPWMSTALQRMKMLQGFEDASLVNARAGASKMGFYESEDGSEFTGDGQGEEGEIIEDFEAGVMRQLPPGVTFRSHDPTYPNGEFATFMKSCLRGISSGLSVSYNTLANDLEGVNFSSMRHGAVEEREVWKELQSWLIANLIEPVFVEWVERAYTLGIITINSANGIPRPLGRPLEFYTEASYQGKRWDWVDPLKDINSKREEIKLGITSISQIIRDKGHDPETVFKDIVKERELLKSLGINVEVIHGPIEENKQQNAGASDEGDAQPD